MTHDEQKAILTITLYAAFADGIKEEREREEVRRIAEALANQADAPDLARLYQDVLLKRVSLDSAAAALTDQGHIKDFIAAGKTFGKLGSATTGMAFSFATTYALGQVAKRYYAGGRVMNTAMLRDTFQNLLGPAKQMQAQYLPQIQQKAATLDAGQIMAMMRGQQGSPA
jgi:DnaJ-domain-containing protein 1